MPISSKWHFTCPVTGETVVQDTSDKPEGWAYLGSEPYSANGLGIVAKRLLAHPTATYEQITTSPYPDATLD